MSGNCTRKFFYHTKLEENVITDLPSPTYFLLAATINSFPPGMGWACCCCQCVIHLTALVLCVVYGVRVRDVAWSPSPKYLSRQSRKRLKAHLVLQHDATLMILHL